MKPAYHNRVPEQLKKCLLGSLHVSDALTYAQHAVMARWGNFLTQTPHLELSTGMLIGSLPTWYSKLSLTNQISRLRFYVKDLTNLRRYILTCTPPMSSNLGHDS